MSHLVLKSKAVRTQYESWLDWGLTHASRDWGLHCVAT